MSSKSSTFVLAVLCFASPLFSQVVTVELVADPPGPYFGGEHVFVDVYLRNNLGVDRRIPVAVFDFSATILDSA